MGENCVFCEIIAGEAPASIVQTSDRYWIIEPLGPQVPGHVLVIPTIHVDDAVQSPAMTGVVMHAAAAYAADLGRPVNIITSVGAEATQSVFHLHVHVLPRGAADGLRPSWPWVKPKDAGHG